MNNDNNLVKAGGSDTASGAERPKKSFNAKKKELAKKVHVEHKEEETRFSVSTKRGKGKLHPLVGRSMSAAMTEGLKNKPHFS